MQPNGVFLSHNIQFVYECYRIKTQERFRMLSMQIKSRTTQQLNMRRNQIIVKFKTLRLIRFCLTKDVTATIQK